MDKCSRPGCKVKSGSPSHPSRKVNTAKGLSRNDLCVLCLLFVPPLILNPRGSKGKEESISIKYFLSLARKSSAVSAVFFLHPRRTQRLTGFDLEEDAAITGVKT
jgi:hypothetical protein